MSIKTTQDFGENLTTHEISGPVSEEEMYMALEGTTEFPPTDLLLWDMSQADVTQVTPDILRKFIRKAVELGASRPGGRTAVVAPDDLQFGLARMSEAFSEMESAPYSFRPFRTQQDALLWLKSDDPA